MQESRSWNKLDEIELNVGECGTTPFRVIKNTTTR